METERTENAQVEENKPQPYRVRLPGFITEEEVGVGDVIKRTMSAVGIKPCGGCVERAATLNRWMVLSGRRMKR